MRWTYSTDISVEFLHKENTIEKENPSTISSSNQFRSKKIEKKHLIIDMESATSTSLYLSVGSINVPSIIYLNGIKIGEMKSAFYPHCFDLTPVILKYEDSKRNNDSHNKIEESSNYKLEITLLNPLEYTQQRQAEYPYVVPSSQYGAWVEPLSRSFLRKGPSEFGWDWGPGKFC